MLSVCGEVHESGVPCERIPDHGGDHEHMGKGERAVMTKWSGSNTVVRFLPFSAGHIKSKLGRRPHRKMNR